MSEKEPSSQAFVEDRDVAPVASESLNELARRQPMIKTDSGGVTLVPQPSDDPRDPLNWPREKKLVTLSIVCLAAFAGVLQALANSAGFFPQAALYHKTPVQVSYSISAAIAGLAVGPMLWSPLSKRFGRCACIFWSMVLTLCVNIWSAEMTKPRQYNAFVVSRLFGGLFGSAPTTVGSNIIVEVFFLHDRGKCFAMYTTCILLGTVASGTFSGFIVQSAAWPVQFWYNVGLEALVAACCIFFLDETGWTRPNGEAFPLAPVAFTSRKAATYLFTRRLMPRRTAKELARLAVLPFLVALQPVTIVVGLALMVYFAWSVAVQTFLSVFLQEPLIAGGYAFSPRRNAAFTFTQWFAIAAAQLYGHFVNDRLPLIICKRNGGNWHPEYRLHSLWFPILLTYPVGLGIFGACLHYHWHYLLLAFAVFLITFSGVSGVAPCVNYVIEALSPALANEATAAMNFYRLALGIAITFFLFPWAAAVGVQWAFGMMAFFTIVAFGAILAVMLLGAKLRTLSLMHAEMRTEDGVKVIEGAKQESAAA